MVASTNSFSLSAQTGVRWKKAGYCRIFATADLMMWRCGAGRLGLYGLSLTTPLIADPRVIENMSVLLASARISTFIVLTVLGFERMLSHTEKESLALFRLHLNTKTHIFQII